MPSPKSAGLAGTTKTPGGGLLHPVPLLAVALLLLNDHVWKAAYGNWWTGKISDFAGLAFFPLLLQAVIEVGQSAAGRFRGPSRAVLVACAIATAVVFAAMNVSPAAAEIYRYGLGALQWPFRALAALLTGEGAPGLAPVSHTLDPTDLIALPSTFVAVLVGWRRNSKA